MAIWFKDYTLEEIKPSNEVAMLEHLNITLDELGEDYLVGSMPVDPRTHQPLGLLHGGASCVLAESLGSIGANLILDPQNAFAVGLDINANHMRAVRSGRVKGIAKPLHVGRSTQVWEIKLYDEQERLAVVSRLTMAVRQHQWT
ncbi:MAG: hotdog fold thioesterase [Bacteroidota bacterium]